MIPVAEYIKVQRKLQRLQAPVPRGFYLLDPVLGAAECNWIGSDDPSTKWASLPLNIMLPWMRPPSVPHDVAWSPLYNVGSRADFVQSNVDFRDTLDLLAVDTTSWIYPGILRRKLRDARRWEADVAYKALSSDMCWDVYQRHADPDPGPERMQA